MTRKERWILSEWLVAKDRVDRGEELVAHQWETPYAEVDLLIRDRVGLAIIEVKSWNQDVFAQFDAKTIITRRQLERLDRARQFVEARTSERVRLKIAVVSHHASRAPVIRLFDPPILGSGS